MRYITHPPPIHDPVTSPRSCYKHFTSIIRRFDPETHLELKKLPDPSDEFRFGRILENLIFRSGQNHIEESYQEICRIDLVSPTLDLLIRGKLWVYGWLRSDVYKTQFFLPLFFIKNIFFLFYQAQVESVL